MEQNISPIKLGGVVSTYQKSPKVTVSKSAVETSKEDVFVKNEFTTSNVTANTYTKNIGKSNATETKSVEALLQDQEERKLQLLKMVEQAISEQASTSSEATSIIGLEELVSANVNYADLENDDTWGIQAVADRIMAMAESFVGNDSANFAGIKQAVLDGFADAKKKWGGELPEICQKTITEIKNRFDEWENKLFGSEE